MINRIKGKLLEKQPTRVVVDVGGIGFEVLVPLPVSQSVGEPGETVSLHTVLVVREDSLTLYGFHSPAQRDLFLKLVSVSGIGPKIALGALSGSSPEALVTAIREQDLAVLTRLPGIGKKTAERMSVELRDGLAGFTGAEPAKPLARSQSDAVAALVSLGYSPGASAEAVRRAAETAGESPEVETLVRLALARLSAPAKR